MLNRNLGRTSFFYHPANSQHNLVLAVAEQRGHLLRKNFSEAAERLASRKRTGCMKHPGCGLILGRLDLPRLGAPAYTLEREMFDAPSQQRSRSEEHTSELQST